MLRCDLAGVNWLDVRFRGCWRLLPWIQFSTCTGTGDTVGHGISKISWKEDSCGDSHRWTRIQKLFQMVCIRFMFHTMMHFTVESELFWYGLKIFKSLIQPILAFFQEKTGGVVELSWYLLMWLFVLLHGYKCNTYDSIWLIHHEYDDVCVDCQLCLILPAMIVTMISFVICSLSVHLSQTHAVRLLWHKPRNQIAERRSQEQADAARHWSYEKEIAK